ncbi:hypothetical protein RCL1_000858 [Eukaryota sp. TZLM3-RCL]
MSSILASRSFYILSFIAASLIKVLLIPTYRSTDFEVHRNWLAITHSLPLNRWYYDKTSQWTLDYPPLFAFFEYFLSFFASKIDPNITTLTNLNYEAWTCVLFQRFSVIFADLVYFIGSYLFLITFFKKTKENINQFKILYLFMIFFPGLFLIDHVHFQYNGFLIGFLLISLHYLFSKKPLSAAFWFAVCLCFKQIFIYTLIPFFIILLIDCTTDYVLLSLNSFWKLFATFSAGMSVFLISFLPFLKDLPQIFARLFPFKRGLLHNYPAPNFWSLYAGIDLIISRIIFKKSSPLTSGISTREILNYLPLPSLFFTLILSVVPGIVLGLNLIRNKKFNPSHLFAYFQSSQLLFFYFAYHAHEKALLLTTVPGIIMMFSEKSKKFVNFGLITCTTSCIVIFPLLFEISEVLLRIPIN